jgi:hypothetical protein
MPDPLQVDDDRVLSLEPNATVVAFLKARGIRRPDGRYQEHTHPDLVEFLEKTGGALGARLVHLYGFPTLAASNGIVFAYAQGISIVVVRAPDGSFSRDLPTGGPKVDTPDGWVQTDGWLGSRMDWTVREGDAAIDERFTTAAIAAEQLPAAKDSQ